MNGCDIQAPTLVPSHCVVLKIFNLQAIRKMEVMPVEQSPFELFFYCYMMHGNLSFSTRDRATAPMLIEIWRHNLHSARRSFPMVTGQSSYFAINKDLKLECHFFQLRIIQQRSRQFCLHLEQVSQLQLCVEVRTIALNLTNALADRVQSNQYISLCYSQANKLNLIMTEKSLQTKGIFLSASSFRCQIHN